MAAQQQTLSDEDFNRFQSQLIELRTSNYELESKLRKTESENGTLQERISNQEKEITKLQRMSKFPGFQAITKSKSKKDLAELIEENERLSQQMQRHEEDFKLQNQTLLEEVSRLANENESLQQKVNEVNEVNAGGAEGGGSDSEQRRLVAENAVLVKTIEGLKKELSTRSDVKDETEGQECVKTIEKEVDDIFKEILNMLVNSSSTKSDEPNDEGEQPVKYEEIVNNYVNNLKNSLRIHLKDENTNNDKELQFRLDATRQERELLQKEFDSYKELSKKELQQLRDEVGKWEEKAKKKQESFMRLQEEKENMFEEHRKAVEKLKEENQSFEKRLLEIKDIQSKLDDSRAENKSMQSELEALKESHSEEQAVKLKEIETSFKQSKQEHEELKKKYEQLQKSNEEAKETLEDLKKRNVELEESTKQASELAENRKTLLDQTAVERQQEVETQRTRLEGIKSRYELEIQELVTKNNEEIEDLKRQITNNKKLKKELEESKTANEELTTQMTTLDNKSGWLERTLKETEEKLASLQQTSEKQLESLDEEHKQDQEALIKSHEEEIQNQMSNAERLEGEKAEQETLVKKLTQAAKDREVEYRIANKKNDHLVKDLKRQLNTERKRGDQLQGKLQDFIQEIKVKQTYDEIFNPESLQLKTAAMTHKRKDSGSHLSVVSSTSGMDCDDSQRQFKTSSPVESASSLNNLSDETMDLISRIADLQQEKWKLEEKVRHLEENGAVMADDLMQKSLIIQSYIMENKADQVKRSLTLKEKMIDKLKLNNTDEINREMNAKMQRMLEETLARNLQLQKDVDFLSTKLEKTSDQQKASNQQSPS